MDYVLRDLDPKWWQRVKVQAAKDDISLKKLGYKLFAEYLQLREGIS
jgi:hypothetical protein